MLKRSILFVVMTAFFLTVPSTSSLDSQASSLDSQQSYDKDKLIEVCAYGIVHVPRGTKYVKCYGKVFKVKKIVEYTDESKGSCRCPNCCDGSCYVIIGCDVGPNNQQNTTDGCGCGSNKTLTPKDGIALCELWLEC